MASWSDLQLLSFKPLGLNVLDKTTAFSVIFSNMSPYHWLGAYRTNALYSGHIFVRLNDLEDVFT